MKSTHCEFCNFEYQVLYKKKNMKCYKCFTFTRVFVELLLYTVLLLALITALGFMGNAIITAENIESTSPGFSKFLRETSLMGRVYMWGFIWFFGLLGIIGLGMCLCGCGNCCHGDYDNAESTSKSYFREDTNRSCWVCCGPTYYNDRYYNNPFAYWSLSDLCCLCIAFRCGQCCAYGFTANNCGECRCIEICANDCGCDCDGGGGDDCSGLGIVLLIILIVIVVAGIIFGLLVGAMLISKLMIKRWKVYYNRMNTLKQEIVDLDDQEKVQKANEQRERRIAEEGTAEGIPEGVETLELA